MILRRREGNGTRKRKMALSAELAVEQAMDLS
jgi:hypothetical protein